MIEQIAMLMSSSSVLSMHDIRLPAIATDTVKDLLIFS